MTLRIGDIVTVTEKYTEYHCLTPRLTTRVIHLLERDKIYVEGINRHTGNPHRQVLYPEHYEKNSKYSLRLYPQGV